MAHSRIPLQRVGSLVINGGPSATPRRTEGPAKPRTTDSDEEIIPDSEEERKRVADFIEIFSDSDDDSDAPELMFISRPDKGKGKAVEPATSPIPERNPFDSPGPNTPRPGRFGIRYRNKPLIPSENYYDLSDSEPELSPRKRSTLLSKPPALRVDPDVIELTSDSESEFRRAVFKPPAVAAVEPVVPIELPPLSHLQVADPWQTSVNESAILTLDEPPKAWKPIRLPTKPTGSGIVAGPSKDTDIHTPKCTPITRTADPTPFPPPGGKRPIDDLRAGLRSPDDLWTPTKKPDSTPRKGTKKATQKVEQDRREAFARAFFKDMNELVFGGGLPEETPLLWNVKLLTTAGRAHWHRDRLGVETSEIELAPKILDTDERIQSTLAHEMCHLACWMINKDPKESHGPLFKQWAATVMEKRPDVQVTTKHSYEINYPFEWECESCAKVYGRFSKSIDPQTHLCGACKTGTLVPLFSVPKRAATKTPKAKATSRLAITSSRDSPRALDFGSPRKTGSREKSMVFEEFHSDSDAKVLTTAMGTIELYDD